MAGAEKGGAGHVELATCLRFPAGLTPVGGKVLSCLNGQDLTMGPRNTAQLSHPRGRPLASSPRQRSQEAMLTCYKDPEAKQHRGLLSG